MKLSNRYWSVALIWLANAFVYSFWCPAWIVALALVSVGLYGTLAIQARRAGK